METEAAITTEAQPSSVVVRCFLGVIMATFKPPVMNDLKAYAKEIGLPEKEVDKFFDHYESNGWRVGRNPMKSWPAAMRNWKRFYDEWNGKQRGSNQARPDRNSGTTNEGRTSQYRGLGRIP